MRHKGPGYLATLFRRCQGSLPQRRRIRPMHILASIHRYPVKSLGGHAVREARLTDRGLEHDRRWMLVDEQGRFITQRALPVMACLATAPDDEGFTVTDRRDGRRLRLPWVLAQGPERTVEIWGTRVRAREAERAYAAWFSDRLDRAVHLVHLPEETRRLVDPQYATGPVSFADGFPYLLLSQASLDDLNTRLDTPVPMDRFRPNLVIAGGAAFQEDDWRSIRIGDLPFRLVKPCARCVIPTTDQRTGLRGQEPIRTLARYRSRDGKMMFGKNAVGPEAGVLRVGMPLAVGL